MPIHIPGKRNRHGKMTSAKRSVVAVLSLTAMVDLFTVLVVFLLQNYATTGEVLDIPEGVKLPDAKEVKDLKPANVIIVSEKEVKLNNDPVSDYRSVQIQEDWEIPNLKQKVIELIEKGEKEKRAFTSKIKKAVENIQIGDQATDTEVDAFRKVTIQADQQVDFLTLKKIMYTVTEAGIIEINFAVLKKIDDKNKN